MIDLDTLKTPTVDGTKRVKFTLSFAACARLQKASDYTGRTMSDLVETLVHDYLPDDPENQDQKALEL